MFGTLRERGFALAFANHVAAILTTDFTEIATFLEAALLKVTLPIGEIVGSGGGEAQITQRLRGSFQALGWRKRNVEIKKVVDGIERESISHEIDHFAVTGAGNFALEIEWNNKDPFFDRDLENFKRLHAEGVIGIGAIVTRGPDLQAQLRSMIAAWALREEVDGFDVLKRKGFKRLTERQETIVAARMARGDDFPAAWAAMFASDKFGLATTHWNKLLDRVRRGVGNPCPLVLIGLPAGIVSADA